MRAKKVQDVLAIKYGIEVGFLDENGYGESIISEREICYCCQDPNCTRHELQFGQADRKLSKALGLWVWLCPTCHSQAHRVKYMIDDFHKLAQSECDRWYGEGTFCRVFQRNYL